MSQARTLANRYVELLYPNIYSPLITDAVDEIVERIESEEMSLGALKMAIRELEQTQ